MKTNTTGNLFQRDFVAEAKELGSTAATRRGAVRFLLTHRPSDAGSHVFKWQGANALQRFGGHVPAHHYGPGSASEYTEREAKRTAHRLAKRANADAAFRRYYLSALNREEKRLVAHPGNRDTAFARLTEIRAERKVMGIDRPLPDRPWKTNRELADAVYHTALDAGCDDTDWDGVSYCDGRGDHVCLDVIDYAEAPAYHAVPGTVIGLVEQKRRRVYAARSTWTKSDRTDVWVVGRNENGRAYRHQVPNTIGSLDAAMSWIWGGAEILHRQGDIGIAPSHLSTVEGETDDITIGGGHSRHRWIGEVYRNGSIHVRSGFLVHTGNQHPPVYLDGSCWRRIVVGRRSERRLSSRD